MKEATATRCCPVAHHRIRSPRPGDSIISLDHRLYRTSPLSQIAGCACLSLSSCACVRMCECACLCKPELTLSLFSVTLYLFFPDSFSLNPKLTNLAGLAASKPEE